MRRVSLEELAFGLVEGQVYIMNFTLGNTQRRNVFWGYKVKKTQIRADFNDTSMYVYDISKNSLINNAQGWYFTTKENGSE
jgi:hypothetical protein